MIEDVLKAIPLGFVLAFLLGPVFFALLETSAIKGFRAALSLDLGVITADVVFILVAYFSTSGILEKLKDDPALFIFGGGILGIYGVISFIKTKNNYLKEIDPEVVVVNKRNFLRMFIKGFFLNFINVGVLGFWLGLIVLFSPQLDNDGERISVFFGTILATYLIVDLAKILLAKRLNKNLTPRRIFWLKRSIAVVMMVCGGFLIFKGIFPKTSEDALEKMHILPEEENSPAVSPELEGSKPPVNEPETSKTEK